MDDLLGEDWQASKPSNNASLNPSTFASNYSSLRATPQAPRTGIVSPLNISRPASAVNGAAKQPIKATSSGSDAFGSLTGFKSQKAGSNLSIQEQQTWLLEEQRRQQEQQAGLWDTLGSGRGTPEIRLPSPAAPRVDEDDNDDVLAAFNKAAPVDKASHYPPPSSGAVSGRSTPALNEPAQHIPTQNNSFDDDDDPFGLSETSERSNGHVTAPTMTQLDDDDILGDLGRPVTERPSRQEPVSLSPPIAEVRASDDPQDRSLAELVDMGFPADAAEIALSENGGDVQAAVGWLLNQAHEQSKQKTRNQTASRQRRSPPASSRSPQRRQRTQEASMPAWMRQEGRTSSATRRQDSRSPANGEKDPAAVAQEIGSKLFKSANSLWKASQKQMAKTVAEFQQERDASQPRWMQDASADNSRASSQRRQEPRAAPRRPPKPAVDVTDEAAMLDAPREALPQRSAKPSVSERPTESPVRGRSPVEPLPQRAAAQPRFMQQPPAQDRRPATKLRREEVDEQTEQAYVSPARRKRPTPKPEPQREPEVDLFSPAPAKPSPAPIPAKATPTVPVSRSTPAPRPKAPSRQIPSVSPAALAKSTSYRKNGGEAYKRGDYDAAHQSYTAALAGIPQMHPIAIIILSNRSLTALKTGDAKTAVSDADKALEVIGVSQGTGETIELGSGEGTKDMHEFYGKALMRKAEALEHLEKWLDAAGVYSQAIETGVGGAVALKGRDRCQKAVAPKPAPTRSAAPAPRKPPPTKSLRNNNPGPATSSGQSAQAVKKLREANAAAEKADDEKFALTDQVDAKLAAWKAGKADNLRGLLGNMETVLWPEAGWKKVNFSDLVQVNKVKIIYVKAIAKVHPDKVCLRL